MTAAARTETAEQRLAIQGQLVLRNRFVGLLRFAVPLFGLLLLSVLALKIAANNMGDGFSFARITVDPEKLMIETPTYSGIGDDGTSFSVTAGAAAVPLSSTDILHLTDAIFHINKPDGTSMISKAPASILDTANQMLTVEGIMYVEDSRGTTGTFMNSVTDIRAETLVGNGAVDLTMGDGSRVVAKTVVHEAKLERWAFTGATVTLDRMPGEEQYLASKEAAAE